MDENQKIKVIIEDVVTRNPDIVEPIVAQFENGNLMTDNVQCALFRNASQKAFRRQRQRIFCVKTNELTYVGKNFGKSNESYVKEQKFLALLDRSTNRMRLVECSTFLLHPITDDVNVISDEETSKSKVDPASIVEFGGKSAKRYYEKKLANKININEMSTPLTKALSENVTPLEAIQEFDHLADVLPPCDKKVLDASKVYSIDSIVSDDVLRLLYDEIDQNKESIDKAEWISPQMKYNTMSIKFITDEDENMRYCCASLYTEFLIQFLKIQTTKLNNTKYVLEDCPNILEDEIHRQYGVGKFPKRSWDKKGKDKLTCHILVLCLLINGLQFHVETVLKSLGCERKRLLELCRCIGGTHDIKSGYVILKIPLVEPKKENFERKRKRK